MTLAKPLTEYSFVLLVVFILSSFNIKSPIKTYTISIKITNIRNNKGFIQLQLYRSQKTFELETPYKTIRISKQNVTDKTLLYQIKGIAPSNYGIALLDDENGNKKMDYGWLYPKEGFGFSNYYHTGWSKPTFSNFKFCLNQNEFVNMKIRYM